jgi:death-on-curing protein
VSSPYVDYLTVEDLLQIAAGVMDEVAVRDAGLLAAAAGRSRATVLGSNAHPSFEDNAAALLH